MQGVGLLLPPSHFMSGSPLLDSVKGIFRDLVTSAYSLQSLCGLHGFGIYTLHPSKPAAAASLAMDQGCPLCCMMIVQAEAKGGGTGRRRLLVWCWC